MKYIIFSDSSGGEHPFVFPKLFKHCIMARAFIGAARQDHFNLTPISAGFIDIDYGRCFGESESMNLKSRGDADTKLFEGGW